MNGYLVINSFSGCTVSAGFCDRPGCGQPGIRLVSIKRLLLG